MSSRDFSMMLKMSHLSGLTCRQAARYDCTNTPTPTGKSSSYRIIQEGIATFTVGSVTLEARGGQIIIVPAEVPHKVMNLSEQRLKQIDIHVNKQFITDWLEN
jgi:mannose-6-phosphate isomerase-like protein (cupin superfamily)